MSAASLDRLLAALIVGLAATGVVTLVSGSPDRGWLFVVHDLLAGALAAAVVVKLARSVPKAVRARRWSRLAVASIVTVASVLSLAAGFAWVAAGSIVWVDLPFIRWSLMSVHVAAAVLLLPFIVVHLVPRRWRVLRVRRRVSSAPHPAASRLLSRRSLLIAAGYGAVAVLLVGATGTIDTMRGGARRFTGSRFLPGGPPGIPTTFLGEATPEIDAAAWRLRIRGRVAREGDLDLASLAALGATDVTAVLDCTSGWAVEATWTGVPLAAALGHAGADPHATRIDIVSVTGWRASLDADEAGGVLLAWAEGGRPLPPEHGAPLRLVAPDRRGLEWVKWIDRIEVA